MNAKSGLKIIVSTLYLASFSRLILATPVPPEPPLTLIRTLKADLDFEHHIGRAGNQGWQADHRKDRPGYLLAALKEPLLLEPGLHRFTFVLRRGHYPTKGLLYSSYGVFRIEIWDLTSQEKIAERTLQIANFPRVNHYESRWIEIDPARREGHAFEPRVYWQGLANGEIERIEVARFPIPDSRALEDKAVRLGDRLEKGFLENGFVVSRQTDGAADEIGDATTYTGWYTASLAWRYAVTKDPVTLGHLENALQTLHNAIKGSYDRPLLTRYVDENGEPFARSPSKDPYTAFFFAHAAAYPHITNPALKSQMKHDADRIATRFLKENLSLKEGETEILSLAPYFSDPVVRRGIRKLLDDRDDLKKFIKAIKVANGVIPFGDLWPGSKEVLKALKKRDADRLFLLTVPTSNGLMELVARVRDILREQYRQDLFPKRYTYRDYPGRQLETLLTICLDRFNAKKGPRITGITDLKVLGSNALISLHIIRTAFELSKNDQFIDYYRANLHSQDALLKTALDWDGFDETLLKLTAGNHIADRNRKGYLSVLALYTLLRMETNPAVKDDYMEILNRWWDNYRHDDNPLAAAIVDAARGKPEHTGLITHALDLYPEDRRGFGRDYWRIYGKDVGNLVGGGADKLYSWEPIPVSHRPKDSFLWQRNTRRLFGDEDKFYPPTDYLFLYWFARYHKLIPAPEPLPTVKSSFPKSSVGNPASSTTLDPR